jgi:hypothetical protein
MASVSIPEALIDRQEVEDSLTNSQLARFTRVAIREGAWLLRDSSDSRGYYLTTKVRPSAGQGRTFVRVDRELAQAIVAGLRSGGRLSRREIEDEILPRITDAGRYGQGEAILARLLLAATDDRRHVELNDDCIHITEKGEQALRRELRSFWGRLGARARWGRDDPANLLLAS